MRPIAIVILLLIAFSIYAVPASAQSIRITFDKTQIQAKMSLSVHQNMTRFPSQTFTLDASSDANMSAAFNQALRKADSSASLAALTLGVTSNPNWLNLSITMGVTGVIDRQGDIATANVTWKDLNVSADLRSGNLSYNKVGSRYLRPVLIFYENASSSESNPNATIKAVNFFDNDTSIPGALAANQVGNLTVLDFNSLSVPLDQWNQTYNLGNNTTSWRYTPPAALDSSVGVQELNKTYNVFSTLAYNAVVTASGIATAKGDLLRVDVGSGLYEWIMASVVVVAVVLAFVVQILFRRKRKAVRLGRR